MKWWSELIHLINRRSWDFWWHDPCYLPNLNTGFRYRLNLNFWIELGTLHPSSTLETRFWFQIQDLILFSISYSTLNSFFWKSSVRSITSQEPSQGVEQVIELTSLAYFWNLDLRISLVDLHWIGEFDILFLINLIWSLEFGHQSSLTSSSWMVFSLRDVVGWWSKSDQTVWCLTSTYSLFKITSPAELHHLSLTVLDRAM